MNFLKKFLGSQPKGELTLIPSGQLFLKRSPGSPKSASECLYTDAVASIRETSSPHNFLLVVQRAYTEGEDQLKEDDDEDFDEEKFNDERVFLIDKDLKFHKKFSNGEVVISWLNIDGDDDEKFEFVVDDTIKNSDIESFITVIWKCCYERKYQKSSVGADNVALGEFQYDPDSDAESLVSGVNSLALSSKNTSASQSRDNNTTTHPDSEDDEDDFEDAEDQDPSTTKNSESVTMQNVEAPEGDVIFETRCQLNIYDAADGLFRPQDDDTEINIIDFGNWNYWLSIKGLNTKIQLGTTITDELNARFEKSFNSFIFNYLVQNSQSDIVEAYTFLLRFENVTKLTEFQESFAKAYHQHNYRSKWEKANDDEQQFAKSAFEQPEEDQEMSDYYQEFDEEDDEEDEEDNDGKEGTNIRTGLRKEAFSDDEDDEQEQLKQFKSQNKNLTVAFKNDRSYVTNGNRIGVFSSNDEDDLKFATTIKDLSVNGKAFTPSKMMLHTEDRALIMQGDGPKDTLYRMDLERGKIVDEWKVKEDLPVIQFGPSKKFNQMTGEQTFMGISDKGLFKVDPRLAGEKIVQDEYKTYASKVNFSSFGTTENGFIASGSSDGSIRLYDRLGIRAKSLIPAIGDPIKALEVSADGHWLIATYQKYLVLVDLTIKGDESKKLGFQKSFGKNNPPKTRFLKLGAEHAASMRENTKEPLNFTKAYFNSGINSKEQTIVTSSGPYAITWSLKEILRGDAEPYKIKCYSSNVVADNFKFGTDKKVIVALEDDVGMVSKKAFRKADRKSLAFNPKKSFS